MWQTREKLPGSQGSLSACFIKDTCASTETFSVTSLEHTSVQRETTKLVCWVFFCTRSVWTFWGGRHEIPEQENETADFGNDCWLCSETDCCNFSVISGGAR